MTSNETTRPPSTEEPRALPTDPSGERRVTPSWARRWLRRILGMVLVVLFAYGLVLAAAERRLTQSLEEHGERLGSLDFMDFIPPELPEGANASKFLEAAVVLAEGQAAVRMPHESGAPPPPPDLAELHDTFRRFDTKGEAPSTEDLSFFRDIVESYAATLDTLDRASAIVDARYETDYSVPPVSLVVPNLLARLRLSLLLRARAYVVHAQNRPQDAWRDAAKIFRLAHWCARETPTTINALIGRAIAAQAARLARDLIAADSPPGEGERTRLIEEARRVDPQELFARLLAGERAATVVSVLDERVSREVLNAVYEGPLQVGSSVGSLPFLWRPWVRMNVALYVESATQAFELCSLPSHRQEDPQERFRELVPPRWASLARMLLWNCLDVSRKRDTWIASLDHLELALHLEEVRQEDGEYPESLDELDVSFVDPFSGEPYRYRKQAGGYLLWSVFANRRDDDATPPNEQGSGDPWTQGDFVWSVARP